MADVTYTGQIVEESPFLQARKLGLLDAATDLIGKDINLPAYQAADLQGMQQAAIGTGQAYQQQGQGIGSYAPFMQAGAQNMGLGAQALTSAGQGIAGINVSPYYNLAQTGMQAAARGASNLTPYAETAGQGFGNINQGSQTLGQAATQLGGAAQMFDPAMAQQYMNPYTRDVIDQTVAEINRQGDLAQQQASANAVRAGAFGGTREGVQRAELDRNLSQTRNQAVSQLLNQGYTQSMDTARQAFEAQQARQGSMGQALGQIGQAQTQQGLATGQLAGQQANIAGQQSQLQSQIAQGIGSLAGQQSQVQLAQAQGLGQIGQNLAGVGTMQANTGALGQQLAQGDINTYLALGGLQQQNVQNQMDAYRATQTQQAMMPYQKLGFLSDMYANAPSSQSSLTATSAPGTNPLLQAAGLGIAGVNAAAAAKKANLF